VYTLQPVGFYVSGVVSKTQYIATYPSIGIKSSVVCFSDAQKYAQAHIRFSDAIGGFKYDQIFIKYKYDVTVYISP